MSGWLAVAGVVAGYDTWATVRRRPTMSSATHTWQSTPVRTAVVLVACLAMTKHLVRLGGAKR